VAGRNTTFDMTYLTERVVYRQGLVAADATPDAGSIPEIRLDIDSSKLHYSEQMTAISGDTPKHEVAARAYNGHLELYVYYTPPEDAGDPGVCAASFQGLVDGLLGEMDERCHADIRVWAWGGPLDTTEIDGRWCLMHEQSVLTDTLITLRNIPNTKYKVTVNFINGGQIDILEEHTV